MLLVNSDEVDAATSGDVLLVDNNEVTAERVRLFDVNDDDEGEGDGEDTLAILIEMAQSEPPRTLTYHQQYDKQDKFSNNGDDKKHKDKSMHLSLLFLHNHPCNRDWRVTAVDKVLGFMLRMTLMMSSSINAKLHHDLR
jgi:hypothetical protein